MGTNYYVKTGKKIFYNGFDVDEILHIGKSSHGWYFSLHVIPWKNINTLRDWLPYLQGGEIHNEYGEYIPFEVMLNAIKQTGDAQLGHWGLKDTKEEPHTKYEQYVGYRVYQGECGLHYVQEDSHSLSIKHTLPDETDIKGLYVYVEGDFS